MPNRSVGKTEVNFREFEILGEIVTYAIFLVDVLLSFDWLKSNLESIWFRLNANSIKTFFNNRPKLKNSKPLFQPTSGETKRKLPESREARYPRLIGEPPKGKITPVRLSELFAIRLQDPDKWTDEKLAELYQLDKETLSSVLKYFGDFAIVQKRDYPRPQDDVSLIDWSLWG